MTGPRDWNRIARGPDGLSRLTLGEAIFGEREKGVRDHQQIALNILRLYRDDWLARELARPIRSHSPITRDIVRLILELREPRLARGSIPLITEDEIYAAYSRYFNGESIRDICAENWQRWGYANAETARRTLEKKWKTRQLDMRTAGQSCALYQRRKKPA